MSASPIDALYGQATNPSSSINSLYSSFQGVAPGAQSGTIPVSGGGTAAQPNPFAGNSAAVTNAYDQALLDQRNTAGNMQSSYATSAALNAMTPAERQAYQNRWMNQNTGGFWNTLNTQVLPAVLLAVASGGLGAGVGAAASTTLGATGGAVAGGAAGGAAGAIGGSIVNDTPLTLGAIGKGALIGGVTGALGSFAKPVAGQISASTGLSSTASNALVKGGIGAVAGVLSGHGAAGGAITGASNSVIGSILNPSSGGTVFNSGSTALQSDNPTLTNPTAPSNMGDDLDPIDTTGQYAYDNGDGTYSGGGSQATPLPYDMGNPGNINLGVQGGGSTLGGGYTDSSGNVNAGSLTGTALARFLAGMGQGSGGNGSAAGGSNTSLLGSLAGLLSGSGGGANSSLLAQLLGLGATGAGGALSSAAAKSAAGNFAGQTAFNPYSVSTSNGSNTFSGTGATSNLNPGTQATATALNGLSQNSAAALNAGPGAAEQSQFNLLQNQSRDSENKFYQNNLDNQFANGVLSSTAGQYQSQAALDAINKQTTQNQITANNFAQGQQQQQLNNLTAGLNGSNQINASQLAGLSLGGSLGSSASGANVSAYSPSLAANSNSNIGTLLQGLGNGASNSGGANNNALASYLANLMGGH